jgi:hypothetical protein
MLGYDRAGNAARLFENAMRAEAPDVAALAAHLVGVLDETIAFMQASAA